MSNSAASGRCAILHIADGRSPMTGRMQESLGGLGLDVVACKDVHRGLGAMVARQASPFVAAVVCAEWLTADEIEFFSVVARYFPNVPVFVYGRAEGTARSEAAALSMRSWLEPDQLDPLLDLLHISPPEPVSRPSPRIELSEIPEPPSIAAPAEQPEPAVAEAARPAAEPAPPEAEMQAPAEAPAPPQEPQGPQRQPAESAGRPEPAGRPPVPWAPSPHRPKRTPPSQPATQQAGPTPPHEQLEQKGIPPAEDASREPEPLLTKQELDALMADDAAIAPDQGEQAPETPP